MKFEKKLGVLGQLRAKEAALSRNQTASKEALRDLLLVIGCVCVCVVSRVAFAPLSNVKPTVGLIMVAAILCGKWRAAFVGAACAFVSNFVFGQGIWTFFQIAGFGLSGLVFGWAYEIAKARVRGRAGKIIACVGAAFVVYMLVAGPVMDSAGVCFLGGASAGDAGSAGGFSFAGLFEIVAMGVVPNLEQAAISACVVGVLAPFLIKN